MFERMKEKFDGFRQTAVLLHIVYTGWFERRQIEMPFMIYKAPYFHVIVTILKGYASFYKSYVIPLEYIINFCIVFVYAQIIV